MSRAHDSHIAGPGQEARQGSTQGHESCHTEDLALVLQPKGQMAFQALGGCGPVQAAAGNVERPRLDPWFL